MPTPEERATWRTQNADLIEFISTPANQRASRFVMSMFRSYESYTSLTEAQTRAARNVMRELTNDAQGTVAEDDPMQPALADDAVHIPNGTFTINDGSEHLTFKVHTVRNGSLRGKRIIKRQLQYGEFKGFAFLTRTGAVKVWRSFYEDEARSERYIVWARILLAALNERFSDGYSGTEDTFEFTYAADGGYTIQASVCCRRCNRALTDPTSISLGIGPECRNLEQGPRTTAARAHEPIAGVENYVVTGDDIARSAQIAAEADQILGMTTEQVASTLAGGTMDATEQRLITAAQEARIAMRRRGHYGEQTCEFCGRADFRSPQGRGRHMSICRRDHRNENMYQRAVRRIGEYRERNGLVRDDEWTRAYGILPMRSGTPIRAARRPMATSTSAPATPRVHLSALGTVIGGSVWEQ